MASADADVSSLVSAVVDIFDQSATIMRSIHNSTLRRSEDAEESIHQKELLDGLQGATQQVARAFAIGEQSLGNSYGEGHDETKHELARLYDAIRIQIFGPLKQMKEFNDIQLDAEQMLDMVLRRKKVAMDICEQLRRMPDPQVPSVFSLGSPAVKPESTPFHIRSQSSQISQGKSPAVSRGSAGATSASDEQAGLFMSTTNQSKSSSGHTVAGSDRRQSTVSQVSQASQASQSTQSSPPHPSPAAIESLSHRLSIATNMSSYPSSARRTSIPGTPLQPTTSASSNQTTIGSPLQPSMSRQSTMSMSSLSRRPTQQDLPSSTFPNGGFPNGAPTYTRALSPTMSQRSDITEEPHKSNNYHGFCKGAWIIRDDPKKGLMSQVVPVGMYGRKEIFRCKYCSFSGDAYIVNKVKSFDNRVRVDVATGIQYKWTFVAKSHVRNKGQVVGAVSPGYGCTECVDSGKQTSIYTNVAALMEHISHYHQDGVRAAERPADPFWQGETISPEGIWDLYIPAFQSNEASSPIVWTMD